jgi:spectinomycin phosphotransferase
VKAPPDDFDARAVSDCLAEGWCFAVEAADYLPVGAGSYHWVVSDVEGNRRFVTVDDLDAKPWLGETRDSVFDGLRRAFDTAAALRGLSFVVAPISTRRGETLCRVGSRHTIALFPFVDGHAGRHGQYDTADERAAVVTMLGELHQATPAVDFLARRIDLDVSGRRSLEAGLREVDQTWSGGPFSERARRVLAGHASDVSALLGLADRLAAQVATRSTNWVITHGEPHARNVMQTDGRRVLVDWDNVALAPPERDLWMVVSDVANEATLYADATGHQFDDLAANFFRLVWDLKDLAAYLGVLRSTHRETEDTLKAYDRLNECVASRDRWDALLA